MEKVMKNSVRMMMTMMRSVSCALRLGETGNRTRSCFFSSQCSTPKRSIVDQCRVLKNIDEARAMYDKMVFMDPPPSRVEFNKLLRVISNMKDHSFVITISRDMERHLDIGHDTFSLNLLIRSLCQMLHVRECFSCLGRFYKLGLSPTVDTYHSLIMNATWNEALSVWEEMSAMNIIPRTIILNLLVRKCSKAGQLLEAERVFLKSTKLGVNPDCITFNEMIEVFFLGKRVDEAEKLFESMLRGRCEPDVYTHSIFINGYGRLGETYEAYKFFCKNCQGGLQDVVTYTTILKVLCGSRSFIVAEAVIGRMIVKGLCFDMVTYSALFDTFSKYAYFKEAATLFKQMQKSRIPFGLKTRTILIDGMFRMRRARDAWNIFTELSDPDICTCNTMIEGLCNEGLLDEAIDVFRNMKKVDKSLL